MPDQRLRLIKLAAKSQSLERSDGGVGGLTAYDVAATMAGLPDAMCAVVRGTWTLEPTVQVVYEAMREAFAGRGKGREAAQFNAVVYLAVLEAMSPQVCPRCGGREYVREADGTLKRRRRPCRMCQGTGHANHQPGRLAKLVGLRRSQWMELWHRTYVDIVNHVHDLDRQAREVMGENASGGGS